MQWHQLLRPQTRSAQRALGLLAAPLHRHEGIRNVGSAIIAGIITQLAYLVHKLRGNRTWQNRLFIHAWKGPSDDGHGETVSSFMRAWMGPSDGQGLTWATQDQQKTCPHGVDVGWRRAE